jgi:hypothetical protein
MLARKMLNRLITLSIIFAVTFLGQTNRGTITGTIFDTSGSAVANANVTLRNLGTGQTIRLKSSSGGAYSAVSLDPVTYSLVIEAPGFRKAEIDRVKVDTGSVVNLDVKLLTGDVRTEVTVEASASLINTESGTSGTTVNERQIQDIPLVNRSVLDLALTQPGVSGDAGSEDPGLSAGLTVPGFNLSVNGGRPGSTNFLADGVNNTGVSLGRAMVSFSPETVQEFSVQTSAFSAEYGQTGGGIISATTKSGTNDLNGTALWYNRNPYFGASPFTTASRNRPKPTLKYNQFSLAVGGPVVIPKIYDGHNKTFWFAAIEPRYRRDFLPQDTLLPTDAMRQGDFSNTVATSSGLLPKDVAARFNLAAIGDATIYNQFAITGVQFTRLPAPAAGASYQPFPGNIIPKSMLDSSALKALKYIAEPGDYYINSAGNVSNLPNPRLLRQNETRYTFKVDQVISDKNRVSVRYTETPIVKNQFTPASTTTDGADYSRARQALISDSHIVSATMVNDLRLSYTHGRFSTVPSIKYDPFSGANLNTELGLPNITKGGVPLLPFIGTGGSSTQEDREERYGITDIFYVNHSKMSWKFGVDISHSLQNEIPLFGATGGRYNFDSRNILTNQNGTTTGAGGNTFAQFLLGVPDSVDLRTTLVPYYYRWEAGAAFVQNDWKVRPNLTVNLGLRYSLNLPRTEKYDHQGTYRPDLAQSFPLPSPIALLTGRVVDSGLVVPFAFVGKGGRSRYMYPADYRDFEPRFGFAYAPEFARAFHVSVRGGYGISHTPITGAARQPRPDFSGTQNFNFSTGQRDPNFVMRLGENPPVIIPQTVEQAIGVPSGDGITYLGSLNYSGSGFAVSQNVKTPYSQNWNFTISTQPSHNFIVEIAYLGNKGTHLFLPGYNLNPKDVSLLSALNNANVSQTATIPDPLGRVNTAGRVITVQQGTLGSPYLGFTAFNQLYDASANSIRHAAYIRVDRRVARGLTFTSNYTFGKSIDDSSSSGVDSFVLSTGQTSGNLVAGAGRRSDRSVSLFDVRHVINFTSIYDLPFGRGRQFMAKAPALVEALAGGWTVSGVARRLSGLPAWVTIVDGNQLTDTTHTLRPDVVPGQPLLNPLYDRNCPVGGNCQPYLNPSAFSRPVLGQLGDAPRTLNGARGPWQQLLDFSIQKNFRIGDSGKRRLQFRADFLNLFNHPIFGVGPNNTFTDFESQPNGANLTNADYDIWARLNGQPLSSTTGGAANLTQVNANLNAAKVNGVLPTNFFSVPTPKNFWGTAAGNFDITTLGGLKLFRLRQAYNTSFGDLYQSGQPRYIQLGLKLYF